MYNRLLIIVFMSVCSSLSAQTNELQIAFVESPMLTESRSREGLGYGAISDVISNACSNSEIKFSPIFYPLKRAVINFESDKIPFLFGSHEYRFVIAGKSPEVYKYVSCAVSMSSFFYYKPLWKNEIKYKEYSDLRGLRVGIPRGLPLKEVLENAGITVEEFNSVENATKMLVSGRIELLFQFEILENFVINRDFKDIADQFSTLDNASNVIEAGLIYKAENKNAAETAAKFKKGMITSIKNGEYLEIVKRYYYPSEVPQYQIDFIKNYKIE